MSRARVHLAAPAESGTLARKEPAAAILARLGVVPLRGRPRQKQTPLFPPSSKLSTNTPPQVCAATTTKNVEEINRSLGKLIKDAALAQANRKSLLKTSGAGMGGSYVAAAAEAQLAAAKAKAKAPGVAVAAKK